MTESLLKKYNIPINHLDFDYIKTCENVKEIERIVIILKSGEEGYYPDLVNCALEKLRSLNPNSKILREEVPVLTRQSMNNEEWNHISSSIYGWTENIKKQTEVLCDEKPFVGNGDIYPIRQFSQTNSKKEESQKQKDKRIKSCDYAKWDKYCSEAEILKMDLNDEIGCDNVKDKDRKNITIIDHAKTDELVEKLSTIEREDLANKHRIKGNEFYKATDFDEAIREYSLSIRIYPTASAFNNRAITYLKIQNLEMTVADCEQCLLLEPNNIKALLRKAQALHNQLKYRDVHDECMKILSLDSNNKWAKEKLSEIKLQIPDLPPKNAFRMKIMEENDVKSQKSNIPVEDDFANLIIPNKIIPSKLSKLKSNFVLNKNVSDKNKKEKQPKSAQCLDDGGLKTSFVNPLSTPKITEYCNGVIIEEL